MKTWQIIGASWQVARRGWAVGLLVGLVLFIFSLVGQTFAGIDENSVDSLTTAAAIAYFAVAFLLLTPWVSAGCLGLAMTHANAAPAESPLGSFLAGGRRLYLKMLGFGAAWVLVSLAASLIVAVGIFLFVGTAALGRGTGVALGPVALGSLVLLLTALMAITTALIFGPIAVAGGSCGIWESFRHSLMVGRSAMRLFLSVSGALALTLIPAALIGVVGAALAGDQTGTLASAVQWLLAGLAEAVVLVVSTAAYVLIYRQSAAGASAAS